MNIEKIPNSVLEQLINEHYEAVLWQAVMHDRFVIGLPYEAILRKIYPNWDWFSKRLKKRKIVALKRVCDKFRYWAEKEIEE